MNEHNSIFVRNVGYSIHKKPFSIDSRSLNFYLLRLQAEGKATVILNNTSYINTPGDLVIGRPGDNYELIVESDNSNESTLSADYFLICDHPNVWLDQWWNGLAPTKVHINLHNEIVGLWKMLINETKICKTPNIEVQNHLIQLLYILVKRLLHRDETNRTQSYIPYKMKKFIESHALEKFTLQDVADFVGLGVSRACQLFRETFEQSVMDYTIDVRLGMAKDRIMYDTMTLEEVCYASGFRTYNYFGRAFRSRFGQSPLEFKQSNQIML